MQRRKTGKSSALGNTLEGDGAAPLLVFIGARIRETREATDVSQDRFSFAAEIERSYYGSIERGKRNLTVATLVKIATALRVDAGSFLPTNEQATELLSQTSKK